MGNAQRVSASSKDHFVYGRCGDWLPNVLEGVLNEEDRKRKVAEAKARYGRDFVHERPISKKKCAKSVLPKSQFQHQKKPFNVEEQSK